MKNNWNLSENVHHPNECSVCKIDDFSKVYFESDVKEFIKLLKEKGKCKNPSQNGEIIYLLSEKEIDELAGERLKELRNGN